VSDLTSNPTFPSGPTSYDVLSTNLMIPPNVANDYGSYIRGFVEAPQTGDYTFWLAAVDSGELWLSTSEDPAGKVLIAQNPFRPGQGPNDWFIPDLPNQESAPIHLVAGQKYYFEVLHKEDAQGTWDSCSVAWKLPDGTFEGPIPEKRLWPFPVDLLDPTYPPQSKAPQVLTDYNGVPVMILDSFLYPTDGGTLDLEVTAEASQPATVQWFSNDVAIAGANLLSYHVDRVTTAMNGAVYSVKIQNALGETTASTTLTVFPDGTPPTLVDALSLANTAGDVAVVFSEPVDPVSATATGNYTISPSVGITGARIGATPDTVLLQTAGLAVGTSYTITVNSVKDRATTPNTIAPASSRPIEEFLGAWYRLDESTGTTAADSSGKGLDGTFVADAYPGYEGKVLKSVNMRGVQGGYVDLPSGFSDFSTNGMTVSLWAYPTSEGIGALWARFIDFANGAANDNILFARTGTANQFSFEVYTANVSGGRIDSPLGTLIVNQWQHFAATLDPFGTVVIYRNGIPVATGMTAIPTVIQRNNNYLGLSNWGGDGHYAGGMDDVRVYNRVLSPAAIAALANGGGPDDIDPSVPVVSAEATVPVTAFKNTPPGVITLTRSGPTTSPLTVQYSLGGTATNGVAYQTLPTSVIIPAGTNSVPVLITPIDYSFQEAQQIVILTISNSLDYAVAFADSGTVTIQNNDAGPAAIAATTDNGFAGGATSADVWFAASVANPSATTLANYTLINAPGISITSATLTNRSLRVVLGLSGPVPADAQLGVTNVLDPGGNTVSVQIPIRLRLAPVNLVANVYHSPDNNRPACYTLATDGVIDNINNSGGFDTWSGGGRPSEFVGLIYDHNQDFEVIKVDLGNQFGDGGSWISQPKVYILKNPVDSNQTRPETDPTDWAEVPAILISGSQFQFTIDPSPSPNTPIVFDLSGLSAAERNGYGWAVGGVKGSGSADFISISEVTSYGTAGATPALAFVGQPTNATVMAGQRAKFQVTAQSTMPITYQWLKDGSPVSSDGTQPYYGTPPALLSDDGAQFSVQLTAGSLAPMTSDPATLSVLARTNPPVLAAIYDSFNNLIEVWFNGATETVSSQNPGNYTLNDPSSGVSIASPESQGCGVILYLSAPLTVASPTITVANVLDLDGNTMPSSTVPVLPLIYNATNVVANAYQQGRDAALMRSTDNTVINDANVNTWTTYGSVAGSSDFVGLGYAEPQVFGAVKVDLGWQFGDGGDWADQPMVFILKHPVDTNQKWPETDPADWVAVPATLVSGNIFGFNPDSPAGTVPLPNSPIVFDLSHLPLADQIGYGWAVGGVHGNGPAAQFVSIAEARAFGSPASTLSVAGAPQIPVDITPSSALLPVGSPFTFSVPLVLGDTPFSYQWQRDGADLSDSARITGTQTLTLNVTDAEVGDSGDYRLVVSNSSGSATSSVAHVTVTAVVTFNGNGDGWTLNTVTTNIPIVGNVLTLTHGAYYDGRSCFLNLPVFISTFHASFTYQDIGGGGADGAAFIIQNSTRGATALGGVGGGLGYSGIAPSVALEINVYSPNTVGINLRDSGATGGPYASTSPVNLASGNPIDFVIGYDGLTLSVDMMDTVAGTSFSTNYVVDIPTLVFGDTAFVGFSGATGGLTCYQQIRDFMFSKEPIITSPPLSIQPAPGNMLLLTWPGSASGFAPYQTSDLSSGTWNPVSGTPVLVGGQYQLEVPISGDQQFYRLQQ